MRPSRVLLALLLSGCVSGAASQPAQAPGPPVSTVETTGAALPLYTLASNPGIRVSLHAPRASAYRPSALGSKPVTVELTVGNATREPQDIGGADLTFEVRRGATRIPCAARNDSAVRPKRVLLPGQKTVVTRDLCSLPLPGEYVVDALFALPEKTPEHVGSFPFYVSAAGASVPKAVAHRPGLFAAMGGDLTGVRFTRPEWESGAYHVMVRLTNAGTNPVTLSPGQIVFRVTQQGRPLACSATYDLALPGEIASGESSLVSVPVTCLIDERGKYEIHASLAMGREETPLGDLGVEVTSNPLIYLPMLPY